MKRIVICADGTWNEREQTDSKTGRRKPSNVTKLARAVLPRAADGCDQVVFYYEGVGTDGGLDKLTGGAFGSGMSDNIRALYRFIVYNYVAGDQLFFFGFSRGAFTVRSLAGFMKKIGLIDKDGDFYTLELYELYRSGAKEDSAQWQQAFHNVRTRHACPPIRCIGVWDTVGALGAPGIIGQLTGRGRNEFHDISLGSHIENAFHALSIDEHRKPFAPSFWSRPSGWSGQLEQAWFPGVHTNVGGGYDPDGVANEALQWVAEKAENLGLEFDKVFLQHYRPCFNSTLRDSMRPWYQVMGDYQRPIGAHPADGEMIHQSAIDRRNLFPDYRPKNLEVHLAATGPKLPIANTSRLPRGTPC